MLCRIRFSFLFLFFFTGLYYFCINFAFSRYADVLKRFDSTRLAEFINPGGGWPCFFWHDGQSLCASNYLNHEDALGCHMKLSLPVTSETERNSMLTCGDPEAVSGCEVSVLGSWQTKCPFGLVDPLTSYRQRSAKRSRRARFRVWKEDARLLFPGGQPPYSPPCAAKSEEHAQRREQPEQEVHTLVLLNAALGAGMQPAGDIQVFLWSSLLCQRGETSWRRNF